ncbi:MAG: hypothetical protein AAF649_01805 [Verrucomicrobiota bacterium]
MATAYSEEISVPPVVDSAFEAFSKAGVETAYTAWGLKFDEAYKKKFFEELSQASDFYGEYLGYEAIRSDDYSKRHRIVHILARHKKLPLFYTFYCYRPEDTWRVLTVKFSGTTEFIDARYC